MNSIRGGKFLQSKRLERNITQEKFAPMVGLSRLALTRIESGSIQRPSLEDVVRICRALGIPLEGVIEAYEI
jgi:transcriptional regulator with XRE-family HTH domain